MKIKGIKRKAFGIKRRKPTKAPKRPSKRSKPKKRKTTKADFLRSWGIHPKAWIRYSGLKGVYWFWFSRTIRDRDYELHGGLCMTCLQPVERGDDQAGHLFAARNCGFALLFHPMNVHLQHSKCNNPRFTPSAGVHNTLNIAERYGHNIITELINLSGQKTKEWSKTEYESRIRALDAYKSHEARTAILK